MGVADRQLDADQPARDQASEELAPERLGLGGADIEADDLATAGLVDGVRDHHALARDTAAVTDLLDLRVNEQIRVAPLHRALTDCLALLAEPPGDPADAALGDPQPAARRELVEAPGRHAARLGLLHHRARRLLGSLSGLQEGREVAALADLRDLQLDR